MIENRPRESLVQYENPIEVSSISNFNIQISGGFDVGDPFKKSFGKLFYNSNQIKYKK